MKDSCECDRLKDLPLSDSRGRSRQETVEVAMKATKVGGWNRTGHVAKAAQSCDMKPSRLKVTCNMSAVNIHINH